MNELVRCVCALALLSAASARRYERCELARDLLRYGVEREHLATWVCIAYHESRFDTAAVNQHSHDYGILQISALYWCGSAGANVCGVPCSDFLDDEIEDDVRCAQRIYREHTAQQGDGFMAWVAYSSCREHHVKKYLADCEDLRKNFTSAAKSRAIARPIPVSVNATYYKNIDQLKPPKFVERALDSGEKFGREPKMQRIGLINSKPFKFQIDELRLPVFGRITSSTHKPSTTTTTTTSTTVITPSITTPDTPRATSRAAASTTAVPKFLERSTNRATTNRIVTPVPRPRSTHSTITRNYPTKMSSNAVLSRLSSDTRGKLSPIERVTATPEAILRDSILQNVSKEQRASSTEAPRSSATSMSKTSSTSAFDLYLNTRKPSPSTYSFAPFTGKRYRFQIFSGGSTTPYTPLLGKYLDLDLLKRSSNEDNKPKLNRYLDERDEPGQEYT